MFFIIGFLGVTVAVLGSYMAMGGKLGVLWQPFEYTLIVGAAICAYVIASGGPVLKMGASSLKKAITGAKYKKADYLELLGVLYAVFRLAKTKGDLALESHVENPNDSPLFQKFPKFSGDHHAVEFLCDYLRLITLGTSNAHEVEAIMDAELDIHHDAAHKAQSSLQTLADSFPAIGIVAAVLGVIKTMGSITEPPEVLGHLIGGALVGTFAGILISYGYAAPIAAAVGNALDSESRYLTAIKAGIIGHMQGYAPQVSIEFSRKALDQEVRPTFAEVEEMIQNVPTE